MAQLLSKTLDIPWISTEMAETKKYGFPMLEVQKNDDDVDEVLALLNIEKPEI